MQRNLPASCWPWSWSSPWPPPLLPPEPIPSRLAGAQANETYKIYKMLDLVVNNDKTAYSYTVNSDWVNFFTGEVLALPMLTSTHRAM